MRKFLIAVENWALDDESDILGIAKLFLIVFVALALAVTPFAVLVYAFGDDSPSIVLNRSQWECAHTRTMVVPMMAGKVVTMIPETQCDAWVRKP